MSEKSPFFSCLHSPAWGCQAQRRLAVVKLVLKYKPECWAPSLLLARKLESVLSLSLWNSEKTALWWQGQNFIAWVRNAIEVVRLINLKCLDLCWGLAVYSDGAGAGLRSSGHCFIPETRIHVTAYGPLSSYLSSAPTEWNHWRLNSHPRGYFLLKRLFWTTGFFVVVVRSLIFWKLTLFPLLPTLIPAVTPRSFPHCLMFACFPLCSIPTSFPQRR